MKYSSLNFRMFDSLYKKIQKRKYEKLYKELKNYCKEYNFTIERKNIFPIFEILTIEGIEFRVYIDICSVHIRKVNKDVSRVNHKFYGLFNRCIHRSILYIEKELLWDNEVRFKNRSSQNEDK